VPGAATQYRGVARAWLSLDSLATTATNVSMRAAASLPRPTFMPSRSRSTVNVLRLSGAAVSSGVGFLPIYLGPTLTFVLGWIVIRKIIRISKVNRIMSIADFIASRCKSFALGDGPYLPPACARQTTLLMSQQSPDFRCLQAGKQLAIAAAGP